MDGLAGRPILLSVYEGHGIIPVVRRLMGAIDPFQAEPYTFQARFSTDSLEAARLDRRVVNNVIHGSADSEAAECELLVWKPYLLLRD